MKIKIIHTTIDSTNEAINISKLLVNQRLSPCVQMVPKIKSIYNWKGKLEKSDEILLIIKTIPQKVHDCIELILKYHNYNVPELIVTDGEILDNDYREWFIENS